MAQKVSLVIPIHNEKGNIEPLLKEISEAKFPEGYELSEIIMVDDGSTDGSEEEIMKFLDKTPQLTLIELERNFGQTSALSAGFDQASGEIVVCLDGDLQNDPKDIGLLLEKINEGYDVVSGWRKNRKDPWLRSFLSRGANNIIAYSTGLRLHDYGCTLKAYRKKYLDKIHLYGEMHRFIPIYLQTVGANVCELPVNHKERTWGASKYGLNRTFKVILDLMVIRFLNRFSNNPIYLFGTMGILSIIVSLIAFTYMVVLKYTEDTSFIQTPLPLMSFLSLCLGILFIFLGLLAELLVRVYYESQNKSTYLVKTVHGGTNADSD